MEIFEIQKRQTYKRVTVVGLTHQPDKAIAKFAMRAAGENESSLFGWTIDRNGTAAHVFLNTD